VNSVADELRRSRHSTCHWRRREALGLQTRPARGTFCLEGKLSKILKLFPISTLIIKVERNCYRVASQWLVSVISPLGEYLLLTGRAQLEGPPVRGLAFAAAISIQSSAECSHFLSLQPPVRALGQTCEKISLASLVFICRVHWRMRYPMKSASSSNGLVARLCAAVGEVIVWPGTKAYQSLRELPGLA
jgi:hypothetical protein